MGTARVLLLGDPVAHSLSPAMQNAAFRALGIDAVYETRRVRSVELGAVVGELRQEPYLGANVTIPHKEAVLGLVDEYGALVEEIGAANTLVRRDGRLEAHNTDLEGFRAALRERRIRVAGARALVLGAGGAARAIVAALVADLARVDVAARRREQADALVSTVAPAAAAREWPLDLRDYDLVVNATPLGMRGEDALEGVTLRSALVVVDIVPVADETILVRRAKAEGCVTIDGLPMLVHQAAGSFALWTGRRAPLVAMRGALRGSVRRSPSRSG